ncbi:MAG: hypothetical protein IBX57_00690 [Gammaproteobacteria bacterium]|nr:hypothetical protein [Gammaproteobacteria bacterium]
MDIKTYVLILTFLIIFLVVEIVKALMEMNDKKIKYFLNTLNASEISIVNKITKEKLLTIKKRSNYEKIKRNSFYLLTGDNCNVMVKDSTTGAVKILPRKKFVKHLLKASVERC